VGARGPATLLLASVAALGVGCSYDFDRFVHEQAAASSAGQTSSAGRAGAGSSGAGVGGHGGEAGTSDASGAAGVGEEAGSAGVEASGGRSGSGGRGASGDANLAGDGGRPTSGASGSGGGGAPSSAGHAGQASSGAAGSGATSCTGSGATAYGGHCYFLVGDDSPLDWPSAKSACAAHSNGAHLVTVGSTEEQAMLAASFFPATVDAWLGLSLDDVTKDPSSLCKLAPDQCPFEWITGEKLEYTNWTVRSGGDSEPNYTGACVRMQASDETWGDNSCSVKLRAICEEGG
jgi:hypothetical protein